MIPALLSAVFVIYLYIQLKREDFPEESSPTNPAGEAGDLSALTVRVVALQERLQRLADQTSSGRTKP